MSGSLGVCRRRSPPHVALRLLWVMPGAKVVSFLRHALFAGHGAAAGDVRLHLWDPCCGAAGSCSRKRRRQHADGAGATKQSRCQGLHRLRSLRAASIFLLLETADHIFCGVQAL